MVRSRHAARNLKRFLQSVGVRVMNLSMAYNNSTAVEECSATVVVAEVRVASRMLRRKQTTTGKRSSVVENMIKRMRTTTNGD